MREQRSPSGARKVDVKTVQMTITVDDPRTFTQPWTSEVRTPLLQPKASPNGELPEVIFAPGDGKEFNESATRPAGEPIDS